MHWQILGLNTNIDSTNISLEGRKGRRRGKKKKVVAFQIMARSEKQREAVTAGHSYFISGFLSRPG